MGVVFMTKVTIFTRISLIVLTRILYNEFSFDITYTGIYEKMGCENFTELH